MENNFTNNEFLIMGVNAFISTTLYDRKHYAKDDPRNLFSPIIDLTKLFQFWEDFGRQKMSIDICDLALITPFTLTLNRPDGRNFKVEIKTDNWTDEKIFRC